MATNNAINEKRPIPAFKALSAGAADCTGDGTYYYVTGSTAAYYDYCNNWSDDTFTADRNGVYIFTGVIEINDITSSHTEGVIAYVQSGNKIVWAANPYAMVVPVQDNLRIPFSFQTYIALGGTIKIMFLVAGGTKVIDVGNNTMVEGSLLFSI